MFFSLLFTLLCIVYLAIGFYDDEISWLQLIVGFTVFCTLYFRERYILTVLLGSVFFLFFCMGVKSGSQGDTLNCVLDLLVGVGAGVLVMSLECFKRRTWHTAECLVKEDTQTYNDIWDQLCNTQGVRAKLITLEVACQCRDGSWPGVVKQLDQHGRPVQDIGQIFAQAWAIDPVLGMKTDEWATAVGADHRKPAPLKKPERAIQKVHRTYGGDPSRLLDITRRSIVLKNVSKLVQAVQTIKEDQDVEIIRIKNRMSLDAPSSLGYRDININLMIKTPDTEVLGVDYHVAEVQLILDDYYAKKSDEGHKAYVTYRNLKGD